MPTANIDSGHDLIVLRWNPTSGFDLTTVRSSPMLGPASGPVHELSFLFSKKKKKLNCLIISHCLPLPPTPTQVTTTVISLVFQLPDYLINIPSYTCMCNFCRNGMIPYTYLCNLPVTFCSFLSDTEGLVAYPCNEYRAKCAAHDRLLPV